jgi:gamma-D-glutamyl-L-lysine dipeptidyl-peptidase
MDKYALINSPYAPLMSTPQERCELSDEALHGMKVKLTGRASNGWVHVRTHYAYEGYVNTANLTLDESLMELWESRRKMSVLKAQADILSAPAYRAWRLTSLPRGALVAVCSAANEDGWMRVGLCDGREGYAKAGFLGEHITSWSLSDEPVLRKKLVESALAYLGVQYRWGGKTPQGIDCSGLCSMAYLLNGIVIYRDADIRDGFCMRKISMESIKEGDLVFFRGHVAMHIGENRIVHSTAKNGSDGVVLNSLNPEDADFRPDLPPIIRFAGTVFQQAL